jgi:hypothetical protein
MSFPCKSSKNGQHRFRPYKPENRKELIYSRPCRFCEYIEVFKFDIQLGKRIVMPLETVEGLIKV